MATLRLGLSVVFDVSALLARVRAGLLAGVHTGSCDVTATLAIDGTDVLSKRTSGGAWRTLQGLADFAVVQSYLSTAAKWGIDARDALTMLFTAGPWLPAAIRPG